MKQRDEVSLYRFSEIVSYLEIRKRLIGRLQTGWLRNCESFRNFLLLLLFRTGAG